MTDIHGDSMWTKLLWGTSMTIAAMTDYARIKAGKHYPSDIIASAVVGIAIGYMIPNLDKKKKNDRVSLVISPNGRESQSLLDCRTREAVCAVEGLDGDDKEGLRARSFAVPFVWRAQEASFIVLAMKFRHSHLTLPS
jgi:hypothetical protein